ncbi:hypothetical protein MMC31_006529 [Peltigera leucophlebia]|nr:hypothetical protein [Peltigera leucophlebia]
MSINSPTMARQLLQQMPVKSDYLVRYMHSHITGGPELLTMEGPTWKYWRSTFAHGFSSSHIMTVIPELIEEALVFRDILQEKAEEGVNFSLESITANLAADLVGRFMLDIRFNCQRGQNDLVAALRSSVAWKEVASKFAGLFPVQFLVTLYNHYRMDRYIRPDLARRYGSTHEAVENSGRKASLFDLTFKHYMDSVPPKQGKAVAGKGMDSNFEAIARSSIKLFIFAGYDTTSTTLCYAYHLLSTHPSAARLLRREHDRILGSPPSAAAKVITINPHLLNNLPYTLAVLKETLRLYPPAEAGRAGSKDIILTDPLDPTNRKYPTEGMLVLISPHAVHTDPTYWPRPNEFLPERWLPSSSPPNTLFEALHPSEKEAWRPFSRGSRVCIDQELALTELKLVLALTAREFDVASVYEEIDRESKWKKGKLDLHGDSAWMAKGVMARPRDGMPVRVRLVGKME